MNTELLTTIILSETVVIIFLTAQYITVSKKNWDLNRKIFHLELMNKMKSLNEK